MPISYFNLFYNFLSWQQEMNTFLTLSACEIFEIYLNDKVYTQNTDEFKYTFIC